VSQWFQPLPPEHLPDLPGDHPNRRRLSPLPRLREPCRDSRQRDLQPARTVPPIWITPAHRGRRWLTSDGTGQRRRGHGEDAIYFDAAKNRYVGAISVGFGPDGKRLRRKVTGKTKAEVRDKLKAAHGELDRGLHTSAAYTVQHAVDDWLEGGLRGRSERTRSIYREALKPLLEHIGTRPLRELTARDVRRGLEALSERMSTRYMQLARASLGRVSKVVE
jgi:hypothetical protein